MKKKIIVSSICLLFILVFSSLIIAQKAAVTTPLDFTQVAEGSLLIRNQNDRAYSAVIKSYEGFLRFKRQYLIKFDLDKDSFNDSFYIIGFSDNILSIEVDGFKRRYSPSYYYLDVADTGFEFKVLAPPMGTKYTAYAIIKVSNKVVDKEKISHIQVREGLDDGFTSWY